MYITFKKSESSNSSASDSNSDLLGKTLECPIINTNDSLISNVSSSLYHTTSSDTSEIG